MPEASQRVAGGARSDATGSHSHERPHPGRGASAAAPPKPTQKESLPRQRFAPTEYDSQLTILGLTVIATLGEAQEIPRNGASPAARHRAKEGGRRALRHPIRIPP